MEIRSELELLKFLEVVLNFFSIIILLFSFSSSKVQLSNERVK